MVHCLRAVSKPLLGLGGLSRVAWAGLIFRLIIPANFLGNRKLCSALSDRVSLTEALTE